MVARLRAQSAQLADLLKAKTDKAGGRGGGAYVAKPLETIDTAERDEHGLLVLQREVMKRARPACGARCERTHLSRFPHAAQNKMTRWTTCRSW